MQNYTQEDNPKLCELKTLLYVKHLKMFRQDDNATV